jgi:protocatechuate 3,4-dioxygenase beta subunit
MLAACSAAVAEPHAGAAEPAPTSAPSALTEAPSSSATQAASSLILPPTPACEDDEPTPPQTAGPFYTPHTPQRNSFLEPGVVGTRMTISGYVLDTACQPIAGAMLDFWHCDASGNYDNVGYKLRGHFFADQAGRYMLETIQPGIYPGRTRHFHVRVQAPNQPVLTTQLYFPDEPLNARDRIFRPECLMDVQDNADGSKAGTFNFVLALR